MTTFEKCELEEFISEDMENGMLDCFRAVQVCESGLCGECESCREKVFEAELSAFILSRFI